MPVVFLQKGVWQEPDESAKSSLWLKRLNQQTVVGDYLQNKTLFFRVLEFYCLLNSGVAWTPDKSKAELMYF